MKKFIKKSLLFIFPVFSILIIFEIILEKLPNNYSYKKNYLDKHSKNLKVLFLGNSHVYYGVNPHFIEQRSFNAAYVSQSVNCDYAIFKKYEDQLDSLKFLFLPLDYVSLYNTIEHGPESFRVKNYFNYYGIILEGYFPNSLEIFYGTVYGNIKRVWRVYHRKKLDIYSDVACNDLGWGYWTTTNKNFMSSAKKSAEIQKQNNKNFLQRNIDLYNEIIKEANKSKIKVILLTPPAHYYYSQQFSKKEIDRIIQTGNSLSSKYSDVYYYNFLNDSSFNNDDFFDANHLNDRGAQKLSLRLNKILRNQNFLKSK